MKFKISLLIIAALVIVFLAWPVTGAPSLTNFTDHVHILTTGGTATPALRVNQRGTGKVVEFLDNGTPVWSLNADGRVDAANQSLFLRYQDVAAAPSIYAEAEVPTTTTSITTSILGIETPRNALLALTSDVTRTAGSIVIAGVDARGNSTTESLAMTASADPETLTGAVPWKSITSFTIPTQTAAFTLTVTGGQKFGLPLLPGAASDLYHLTVAATPQTAPTVSTQYGTFDPVSTPAANVDYNVWVKQ